jgi:hypothetical protein
VDVGHLYCPVDALNLATSQPAPRPRSFTSMPCALAHSRTSVVFSPLAGPRRALVEVAGLPHELRKRGNGLGLDLGRGGG